MHVPILGDSWGALRDYISNQAHLEGQVPGQCWNPHNSGDLDLQNLGHICLCVSCTHSSAWYGVDAPKVSFQLTWRNCAHGLGGALGTPPTMNVCAFISEWSSYLFTAHC
jgi:hypothetical protein